ncbi:TRAF-like superfamily protein [Actinidia rufa]|uniref:TRAF-like superfamily protein n=1 Tax=Actinidia rufa TaxID=165716 RepID=A0A7J0EEU0_9ERIC|nr:TRAF-like superfamily protein [Actinidia rufa]
MTKEAESVLEKTDALEDDSDESDSVNCLAEMLQPDSEDRDTSPANWETDTSEVHPPTEGISSGVGGFSAVLDKMRGRNSPSVVDDSSSTCSTDSVPSVVMNGPYKRHSLPNQKSPKSPSRGRNQRSKSSKGVAGRASEVHSQPSASVRDATQPNDAPGSCKAESESEADVLSLEGLIMELEKHVVMKEEVVSLRRELNIKDQASTERLPKEKATGVSSSTISPSVNMPLVVLVKSDSKTASGTGPALIRKSSSDVSPRAEITVTLKSDTHKAAASKPTDKPLVEQMPVTSKPVSALVSGRRPTAPVASMVHTTQLLARSVSAAVWLGPESSTGTHDYVPQSNQNAVMGTPVTGGSTGFTQPRSPSSAANPSQLFTHLPNLMSAPMFLPQISERTKPNLVKPSHSFGMINHDVLQNGPQWMECPQRDSSRSIHYDPSSLDNETRNLDLFKSVYSRSQNHFPADFPSSTSGRHTHGVLADEFPHLDIINDLLDDEHGIAKATSENTSFQSFSNGPYHLNRQFSFPGDIGMPNDMGPSTSSYRFERTQSYHDDGFQRGYGSLGGYFDLLPRMIPQANPWPRVNGHIDGLILNNWPMVGSDLSTLSTRNMEGDGYSYHIPTYSNLACGVNGFTVFPPSNGH